MGKVGMPYLKLDRNDHYVEKDRKDKHSGNTKAVIMEGLEERQSSDPDLDRSRTKENKYYGIRSGEELVSLLERKADEYVITDKKGRKRHLRNDANIGYAIICKPESEYINSLTKEQQKQFFNDSYEIMKQMLEDRGLVVDAAVVHYDEGSPHMHVYGHDPEYNIGRKFDLKMRDNMNRGYYPVEMRKRGWQVEDLPRNYDPVFAKMLNNDELQDYKKMCMYYRKQYGKSAKTYKAEQEAKKIKSEAERSAQKTATDAVKEANYIVDEAKKQALSINMTASAKMLAVEEKERMLAEKKKKMEVEAMRQELVQDKLDKDRAVLDADRIALNDDRATFDEEVENYKADLQEGANMAIEQFKSHLTKHYKEKYESMKAKFMQTYQLNADRLKEKEMALDVLAMYADEYTVSQIARQQASKRHTSPVTERDRINRFRNVMGSGYTWIDEPRNNGLSHDELSF